MLKGKKILITSGPTRVPLDAVRFLTNHSTGTFGTLLATQALKKGVHVTFLFGEGSKSPQPSPRLKTITVRTHREAAKILMRELTTQSYDAVIHAMAVLDFEPVGFKKTKTKTKEGIWNLKLKPTPKIIQQIKRGSPETCLVGFKLEVAVSDKVLLARAAKMGKSACCDFVLANRLSPGNDCQHAGWLLNSRGESVGRGVGKASLARMILQALEKVL